MLEWTVSAEAELERYLAEARTAASVSGADPEEVEGDLRRHIEQHLADAGVRRATRDDLARVLSRLRPARPTPASEPPEAIAKPRRISLGLIMAFGVVLPVITLVFEAFTGLCGELFVNPIPTLWHVLLVATVPLANALAWSRLAFGRPASLKLVGLFNGFAIGVALYYTFVFLPVTPFAAIGIIYFGIGLLPLAPMLSLIMALAARRILRRYDRPVGALPPAGRWALAALGTIALLATPTIVTQAGLQWATTESPATRARGVGLLRALGNDDLLLRSCYRRDRAVGNMVSFLFEGLGRRITSEQAQQVYYRVTGTPYNAVRPPELRGLRTRALINAEDFDWDQGGDAVAGRLRGLSLRESRLDSRIEADSGAAYTEWILVFRNDAERQREARAQVALPPGAVVSRVTLWVDGEEREAAYAGRAKVKAAYQRVVQQRRDPVLVTTSGPDQVLVQCFPVPANGGTMKIKLGITAPLAPESREAGLLRLPYFRERNFSVPREVKHSAWIESPQTVAALQPEDQVLAEHPSERVYALRAELEDRALSRPFAVRVAMAGHPAWAALREDESRVVRQVLDETPVDKPGRIAFVFDGSRSMSSEAAAFGEVLKYLPAGVETAVLLAGDRPLTVRETAPWAPEAATDVVKALSEARYRGGCDNVSALAEAWDLAAAVPGGTVVWIHGPQPVSFEGEEALLQRIERRPNGPVILDLQVGAGPNAVAVMLNGSPALRAVADFGDPAAALARILDAWAGRKAFYRFERTRVPRSDIAGDIPEGSSHLARLWAFSEILRLGASIHEADKEEAVALAVRYRLVTPVSGAVVLETAKQYQESGLEPAAGDTVPRVVPEPQTWMLLLMGGGLAAARAWKRRRARPS
ncbi:MAG TPA: VIT domain-containing protein [Kiritimatiellia bacterium]|nr:VIT domain-containing protein [Kiritimatiellia bacterium]HRZ13568.1 VIT domain-containing protein [Kiritimatiellia bacterium]HSA19336.1 VIT domain-containing protein [Kiritimatiellia bacterium]